MAHLRQVEEVTEVFSEEPESPYVNRLDLTSAEPTPGAPVAPAMRGSGLRQVVKPHSGPRTR